MIRGAPSHVDPTVADLEPSVAFGLHHLAFHADSREDLDRFHACLCAMGARILDPPAEYAYTPCYCAIFFADPDGVELEVVLEPELRGRTGPAAGASGH